MSVNFAHMNLKSASRSIGREIIRLETVDSTNAELLRRASAGAPHGLALTARTQTAGRGRLDRKWHSPPKSGLYFSILLRPPQHVQISLIPLAAGLAVARAVGKTAGVEARIKWPNDVNVAGRKLAGILCEAAEGGQAMVVGIGVNVRKWKEPLPDDIAARRPITLEEAASRAFDAGALMDEILMEFDAAFSRLAAGKEAALLDEVRAIHEPFGKAVSIKSGGRDTRGIAQGIDDSGRFVIELDDGTQTALVAGDVEYVRQIK